jgi:hypothetical protein
VDRLTIEIWSFNSGAVVNGKVRRAGAVSRVLALAQEWKSIYPELEADDSFADPYTIIPT